MARRKIDLNMASAEELEEIDGIDAELANAIVRRREELGAFERWLDVELVQGLDEVLMERLRDSAILGEAWGPSPLEEDSAPSDLGAAR